MAMINVSSLERIVDAYDREMAGFASYIDAIAKLAAFIVTAEPAVAHEAAVKLNERMTQARELVQKQVAASADWRKAIEGIRRLSTEGVPPGDSETPN